MVRHTEIKEYRFTSDEMTANSAGNIDVYSQYPINGRIVAIQNYGANAPGSWIKTGSILCYESGGAQTQQFIQEITSGTNTSLGVNASLRHYPSAQTLNTGGSVVANYIDIPINNVMRIVGTGLGDTKSGLGLNIFYQ